jgi:hypothetical protein
MMTIGNLVSLTTKPGNAHGHLGSVRVKAPKEHQQKSSYLSPAWRSARFLAASFCSRASVLYGRLFAVGYKFHPLSHFLNCNGLPQRLAFALHFHVPRKCLQSAWRKPSPHVAIL